MKSNIFKHISEKKSYFPLISGITLLILINISLFFVFTQLQNSAKAVPKPANPNPGQQTFSLLPVQKKIAQSIDSLGAEKAYEAFLIDTRKVSLDKQHTYAHLMGELLYEKVGLQGITICDNSFAFGCYHSFFGKVLQDKGLSVVKQLDEECNKKFASNSLGCKHGIGHGILYYLGKDKIVASLDICHTLSYKEPIGGCTSGVFMEHNLGLMSNPAGNSIHPYNPQKPYELCQKVPQQFHEACYFEMPQWWRLALGGNQSVQKLGELCENLEVKENKEACFKGIGNIAAPSNAYNIQDTVAFCRNMPTPDGQKQCIIAASWSFSFEPTFSHQAEAVCYTLSRSEQEACAKNSTS